MPLEPEPIKRKFINNKRQHGRWESLGSSNLETEDRKTCLTGHIGKMSPNYTSWLPSVPWLTWAVDWTGKLYRDARWWERTQAKPSASIPTAGFWNKKLLNTHGLERKKGCWRIVRKRKNRKKGGGRERRENKKKGYKEVMNYEENITLI